MAEAFVPVLKRRVFLANGKSDLSKVMTDDISAWAKDQLIALLRKDAVNTVDQQIRLDNPPAFASVDNTRGKPLMQATRRVEVTFGAALKVSALAILLAELKKAIGATTRERTGRLIDVGNWTVKFIKGGREVPFPRTEQGTIPMGPGDHIVIMPPVPYATMANMRVANGSKALTLRRTRSKAEKPTKANQGLGFMAYAARRTRRHASFRGFNVLAKFTSRYKVPGEISWKQGTVFIDISAQLGKRVWKG